MKDILVKNSGIIRLQTSHDNGEGKLFIGEALKHLPFEIKRFYVINGFSAKTGTRGKHAHKKLEQAIFCIHGSFTLTLDDGDNKQTIPMNSPEYGIRLGPLLWHDMAEFSHDCNILVVASGHYDEEDYIRNYEDFIQHIKASKR